MDLFWLPQFLALLCIKTYPTNWRKTLWRSGRFQEKSQDLIKKKKKVFIKSDIFYFIYLFT